MKSFKRIISKVNKGKNESSSSKVGLTFHHIAHLYWCCQTGLMNWMARYEFELGCWYNYFKSY